jgi:TolA-binding protein
MRAERILLEAANAALMRGDHATASASLQEHARTYPRGELAQERNILIAQAAKLKAADKGSAPR